MPLGNDPLGNVKQNRSLFNPMDATMMVQEGQVAPNMTVVQFLEKMGVDPNGPVTQLQQLAKKQAENMIPSEKMKNIAQGAQGPPPMEPQTPPPAGGGGLNELISGMR